MAKLKVLRLPWAGKDPYFIQKWKAAGNGKRLKRSYVDRRVGGMYKGNPYANVQWPNTEENIRYGPKVNQISWYEHGRTRVPPTEGQHKGRWQYWIKEHIPWKAKLHANIYKSYFNRFKPYKTI